MGIRETGGTILVLVALVLVGEKALSLLYGEMSLESFVTPGWTEFALTNPELFAWILIVGTLLFGARFVTFIENV